MLGIHGQAPDSGLVSESQVRDLSPILPPLLWGFLFGGMY